jgi:hypothetical protein
LIAAFPSALMVNVIFAQMLKNIVIRGSGRALIIANQPVAGPRIPPVAGLARPTEHAIL